SKSARITSEPCASRSSMVASSRRTTWRERLSWRGSARRWLGGNFPTKNRFAGAAKAGARGPGRRGIPHCRRRGAVVGGGVRGGGVDGEVGPMLSLPNQQLPGRDAYLVVRASGAPMAAVQAVRAQIAALDDKLPLYEIKSHEQAIADQMAGLRLVAALMVMFGALALALAAVGIYGVIAHAVSQRAREIGVRVAVGARPQDVLRWVVGQALKLAGLGLAIGLPVALALGRMMAGALFGVIALEPLTFVEFTLLLTGVAMLAGYLPARRATKVDPITALRSGGGCPRSTSYPKSGAYRSSTFD